MKNNAAYIQGFWCLLTIVLMFGKILGGADISWWLVFSPLWVPIAVGLTTYIVVGFVLSTILWCKVMKEFGKISFTNTKQESE